MEKKIAPKAPEYLTIEKMFSNYCAMVQIDITKMHPIQLRETRRAFFGAAGQTMAYFAAISQLPQVMANAEMNARMNECSKFWKDEIAQGPPKVEIVTIDSITK